MLARSPSAAETRILVGRFQRMLGEFRRDKKGTDELLGVGESPARASLDRAELATYTTVASMLLNLDETITKE